MSVDRTRQPPYTSTTVSHFAKSNSTPPRKRWADRYGESGTFRVRYTGPSVTISSDDLVKVIAARVRVYKRTIVDGKPVRKSEVYVRFLRDRIMCENKAPVFVYTRVSNTIVRRIYRVRAICPLKYDDRPLFIIPSPERKSAPLKGSVTGYFVNVFHLSVSGDNRRHFRKADENGNVFLVRSSYPNTTPCLGRARCECLGVRRLFYAIESVLINIYARTRVYDRIGRANAVPRCRVNFREHL